MFVLRPEGTKSKRKKSEFEESFGDRASGKKTDTTGK